MSNKKKYVTIKRYGHERGFSVAFRQWRANHSHCSFLHGYALAFELTFECETLDDRNWCQDYGALKPIKSYLELNYDHKTLVAEDDPYLEELKELHALKVIDINIVPAVGCEKVAETVYNYTKVWLAGTANRDRVKLVSVKVSEHDGNHAMFLSD